MEKLLAGGTGKSRSAPPSWPAGGPDRLLPLASNRLTMPSMSALPTPSPAAAPTSHVAALRSFNRFYTSRIGVLDEHLYGTPFTLPQTRVLWELAHREGTTATELARALDLDPGYLSRLLAALKTRRLVRAQR